MTNRFGVVWAPIALLLLLVCWGFLGVTLYLMIGLAGPGASDAARKARMIIGGSDAALLLGILLTWTLAGTLRMDGAPTAAALFADGLWSDRPRAILPIGATADLGEVMLLVQVRCAPTHSRDTRRRYWRSLPSDSARGRLL